VIYTSASVSLKVSLPELADMIRQISAAVRLADSIAIPDDPHEADQTSKWSPAQTAATGDDSTGAYEPGMAKSTDVDETGDFRRDSPDDVALPIRIGDFRIIREIGHGGMGAVYGAQPFSLGRHVALKILLPHVVRDASLRQRFEHEARSAARLHHTNIVPIFGFFQHEGTAYYVMQYIQGRGLDAVIEDFEHMMPGVLDGAGARLSPPSTAENGDSEGPSGDISLSMLPGRFDKGGPSPEPAGVSTPCESDRACTAIHAPSASAAGQIDREQETQPTAATQEASSSFMVSGSGGRCRPDGAATFWQSVAHVGIQVASLRLGQPWGLSSDVADLSFLASGQLLAIGSRAGYVFILPVPLPRSGSPEEVSRWTELRTGWTLDETGTVA
jgi:hypothetical protein